MIRAFAFVLLLVGCSSGSTRSDPASRQHDARLLEAALREDHSSNPLTEVDNAVVDRRPVLAAELIRTGALPALERARAAVAASTTRTPEGNAVRTQLLNAYDEHARTLTNYARALERGEVEDMQLLEAVHHERVAVQNMERAHEQLERLSAAE